MERVILPTVEGMAAEGLTLYRLSTPLMIDTDGNPQSSVNCRFGDPETQPIMHRLRPLSVVFRLPDGG